MKSWPSIFAILTTLSLLSSCAQRTKPSETQIAEIVTARGVNPDTSSLLIVRISDNAKWVSNTARSSVQFSPASTSKIPHTLIALETKTARPETVFQWDGTKRFLASWNQDQTLTTAFKRSAVWVYQDITTQLGSVAMSQWLHTFSYGNANVGTQANLTNYWLVEPLEISVQEQIEFLTKLANETLPLSPQTYEGARKIMALQTNDDWTLYAKTGWWSSKASTDIGWYVGWVETKVSGHADTYVFAFNMDLSSPKDLSKRVETVHHTLEAIGAMPK